MPQPLSPCLSLLAGCSASTASPEATAAADVSAEQRYYTTPAGVTCERNYGTPVQLSALDAMPHPSIRDTRYYITVHYRRQDGQPLALLYLQEGDGVLGSPVAGVAHVAPPRPHGLTWGRRQYGKGWISLAV